MKRRILSAVLALTMLVSLLPGAAFAAQGDPGGVMPLADEQITAFKYRETGYYANGARPNTMWVTLSSAFADSTNPSDYTVTVTKDSGSFEIGNINYNQYGRPQLWWTPTSDVTEGEYTVTVTNQANGTATETMTIVKITFDPNGGQFTDYNGAAIDDPTASQEHYGIAGDGISYALPGMTVGQKSLREQFIGWSEDRSGSSVISNIPSPSDGSNAVTLYAAFGAQKNTLAFEIYEDETGTELAGIVDLGQWEYGDTFTKKLYVINVGNVDITELSYSTSNFDATIERGVNSSNTAATGATPVSKESPFVPGEVIAVTYTAKSTAAVGNYSYGLFMRGGYLLQSCTLNYTITPKRVTVTPDAVTKEYGQTRTSSDVTGTTSIGGVNYADLGVTLYSEGFSADAAVGQYGYSVESWTNKNYIVELAGEAKVIVDQAEPQPSDINATGIKAASGAVLSQSTLSGTFTNPYQPTWAVPGTLAWTDPQTSLTSPSADSYGWTFTPTDTTNYTTATGTVQVVVSEKDPTLLVLDSATTVEYDGQPHEMTFHATRDGGSTIVTGETITVQYKPAGGDVWSDSVPVNAGTYNVRAQIAATADYAAADYDAVLTITQKSVTASAAGTVATKEYDGTVTASVDSSVLTLTGVVSSDADKVTAGFDSAAFDNANAGSDKNVTITGVKLEGAAAGNYALSSDIIYSNGVITPKGITVKPTSPLTKVYGQPYTFTVDQFTAEGLIVGEVFAEVVTAEFSSDGTAYDKSVGTYPITVAITGGNYVLTSTDAGTLEITKATPELQGTVTAGYGRKNGSLSNVALSGTVVNSVNSDMVVEGTFRWADGGNTTLPNQETYVANWEFVLSADAQVNYDPDKLTGTVTITLLDQEPVTITAEQTTTVTYGDSVQIPVTTTPAGLDVQIEYAVQGTELWTHEVPVNAGIYDVQITAYANDEAYANNTIRVTLVINKATPTCVNQAIEAREGTPLSEVDPRFTFTYNSKTVGGTFTWDSPATTVTEDGVSYNWTFTPDDSTNYNTVTGSTTVNLAADPRAVAATVYNLPDAAGYSDYAVITGPFAGDALKEGDVVTFYSDSTLSTPIGTVVITAEVLSSQAVIVNLTNGSLAADGGTIYAKITGAKTQNTPISYPAELGFTVDPASLAVTRGTTQTATVTYAASGYEAGSTVSWTTGDETVATVSGGTVTGVAEGSTMLIVTVTFQHPDQINHSGETITLTQSIPVTVALKIITVTFMLEDETIATYQIAEGQTIDPLPVVSRNDIQFLGWYDADGEEVTTETVFTQDTTVTAKFIKVEAAEPVIDAPAVNPNFGDSGLTASDLAGLDIALDDADMDALKNLVGSSYDLEQAKNALIDQNKATEADEVFIRVVTTIDVTVEQYDPDAAFVLDITPRYTVYATTKPLTSTIDPDASTELGQGVLEVSEPVNITIPIPSDFAADGDYINITHTHSDNTNYYYTQRVENGAITFVNQNGFSQFVLTKATEAVLTNLKASAGALNPTFAPATKKYTVTTYNDSTTVTAYAEYEGLELKINDEEAQSGRPFGPIALSLGTNTINVYVYGGNLDTVEYSIDITRLAKDTEDPSTPGGPSTPEDPGTPGGSSPGGGSGSSVPSYVVSVGSSSHGSVSVSPSRARSGQKVTITVKPDAGYELDTLTVTDSKGNSIRVIDNGDGTYSFIMPDGKVIVNATFRLIQTASPLPFDDVTSKDWFYTAVKYVYENGLMSGVGDGKFDPNGTLTRSMVVTILYNLEGRPAAGANPFNDVPDGQWYAAPVAWAANNGIVSGTGNGAFSPNASITRQDLAVMLYHYAQYKGYKVSGSANLTAFPDAGALSSYAIAAMQWANANGLINGVNNANGSLTLNPRANATRAQAASILMNFCENVAK